MAHESFMKTFSLYIVLLSLRASLWGIHCHVIKLVGHCWFIFKDNIGHALLSQLIEAWEAEYHLRILFMLAVLIVDFQHSLWNLNAEFVSEKAISMMLTHFQCKFSCLREFVSASSCRRDVKWVDDESFLVVILSLLGGWVRRVGRDLRCFGEILAGSSAWAAKNDAGFNTWEDDDCFACVLLLISIVTLSDCWSLMLASAWLTVEAAGELISDFTTTIFTDDSSAPFSCLTSEMLLIIFFSSAIGIFSRYWNAKKQTLFPSVT